MRRKHHEISCSSSKRRLLFKLLAASSKVSGAADLSDDLHLATSSYEFLERHDSSVRLLRSRMSNNAGFQKTNDRVLWLQYLPPAVGCFQNVKPSESSFAIHGRFVCVVSQLRLADTTPLACLSLPRHTAFPRFVQGEGETIVTLKKAYTGTGICISRPPGLPKWGKRHHPDAENMLLVSFAPRERALEFDYIANHQSWPYIP